jgi:Lamin Tail Domain
MKSIILAAAFLVGFGPIVSAQSSPSTPLVPTPPVARTYPTRAPIVPVPQLILSEIMINPTVGRDKGTWFEFYNPGSQPVNLSNAYLFLGNYASSNQNSFRIPNGTIPPNRYFVVGNNDDRNTNGNVPVDWKYSPHLELDERYGYVRLSYQGGYVWETWYENSMGSLYFQDGASVSRRNMTAALSGSYFSESDYCVSNTIYNGAPVGARGTPNATNVCAPLAAPVAAPMTAPMTAPMGVPMAAPMVTPMVIPIAFPMAVPMTAPMTAPMGVPMAAPMVTPMVIPIAFPMPAPVAAPVAAPMTEPMGVPMAAPVVTPMVIPFAVPMAAPVAAPMTEPMAAPMSAPFVKVTKAPTIRQPTKQPTLAPKVPAPAPVAAPAKPSTPTVANVGQAVAKAARAAVKAIRRIFARRGR